MKILVVDDSPAWVSHHVGILKKYVNAQIDTAYCAREGLSKIEVNIDEPYDIVLSDMQMEADFLPKYAGEWFIEQIKMFDEYKNTKIFIISATYDIQTVGKRLGVNFIPKRLCVEEEKYRVIFK